MVFSAKQLNRLERFKLLLSANPQLMIGEKSSVLAADGNEPSERDFSGLLNFKYALRADGILWRYGESRS